ncbi:C-type lectin domain family 2 member D-like [Mantella aurantiaca]
MQIKGDDNRWIGLSRTENNTGWIWANGTLYSENIFSIDRLYTGHNPLECVYLNHEGVNSRKEDVVTKWICSKNLLLKPS